ncbi:hypothetical protein GCM10009564_49060 [Streptomyces thermogriseus]|uniref:Uncharacterized protein n=1 Tax=Streptomyces thermogriseus TaxID=75292 RepID=A0ABP4DN89_9ACTN
MFASYHSASGRSPSSDRWSRKAVPGPTSGYNGDTTGRSPAEGAALGGPPGALICAAVPDGAAPLKAATPRAAAPL